MNINIYLRGENESESTLIGTGHPDDFEALVKAVEQWGGYDGDVSNNAVGQFFVHGKKAGFEVIITHD